MHRIVVVLPAPFGPRKPVTLPGSMPNVRSLTATLSPYRFVRPRTSIMEFVLSSRDDPKSGRPGRAAAPAEVMIRVYSLGLMDIGLKRRHGTFGKIGFRVQGDRKPVSGAADAMRAAAGVQPDAARADRGACLGGLAREQRGARAVAVRRPAGRQDEQPGAVRARHGDADRAVGVEADQVPPALRRRGEPGQLAGQPAVGAGRARGAGARRADKRGRELCDLRSNRKVGVHKGFLRIWDAWR